MKKKYYKIVRREANATGFSYNKGFWFLMIID
jgi:hypothetical protein